MQSHLYITSIHLLIFLQLICCLIYPNIYSIENHPILAKYFNLTVEEDIQFCGSKWKELQDHIIYLQEIFHPKHNWDEKVIRLSQSESESQSWNETEYLLDENFMHISNQGLRRFVIASENSGVNDRLMGILTSFYAALLSNRTFHILRYDKEPGRTIVASFHAALNENKIKWHISEKRHSMKYARLTQYIRSRVNNKDIATIIYYDGDPLFHPWFNEHHPLTNSVIFGPIPTVIFQSNRGNTYHLFKDSEFKQTLAELTGNMPPEFAARCAFHFLFKPNHETLTRSYRDSITLTLPNVVTIGIQIRVGDEVYFRDQSEERFSNISYPYFANFFNCAEYIESTMIAKEYDLSHTKVLWYFMSDSMQLKINAKKRYGDKLITELEHKPLHTYNDGAGDVSVIQQVLAEVYVMSLANYFIFSHDSGIGKLAFWISNNRRDDNAFIEHRRDVISKDEPICKPYNHEQMSITNSGI